MDIGIKDHSKNMEYLGIVVRHMVGSPATALFHLD
jgi:hypothetical protein